MEGQEETVRPCKFDTIFSKSVPHILENIFLSLDYEGYKTCLEVSIGWRELLTSESYQEKARSVFHDEIAHGELKLWNAAQEGKVAEVRIMSLFVDVNYGMGSDLSTPLCEAAKSASAPQNNSRHVSQKKVIQLLLERGADPNIAGKEGWTPLHWAAKRGNKDVIQLLLDLTA